jgi:hypothetical protein
MCYFGATTKSVTMKASTMHAQPVHSVSKVITRLAILGGIILGGMYAFLQICASLMKIFE